MAALKELLVRRDLKVFKVLQVLMALMVPKEYQV